ncbi:Uncharacterised protein [Escherichia coli]|nr:Uncharacterised protein [Escherichia coli]
MVRAAHAPLAHHSDGWLHAGLAKQHTDVTGFSVRRGFGNKLHAVIDRAGKVSGDKLDVVNHFIQQRRIGLLLPTIRCL